MQFYFFLFQRGKPKEVQEAEAADVHQATQPIQPRSTAIRPSFTTIRPCFTGIQPGFTTIRPRFTGIQPGFTEKRPRFKWLQPRFTGSWAIGILPSIKFRATTGDKRKPTRIYDAPGVSCTNPAHLSMDTWRDPGINIWALTYDTTWVLEGNLPISS